MSRKNERAKAEKVQPAAHRATPGEMNPGGVLLICAGLAGLILLVYFPVGGFDYINYDDNVYITDNPHVRAGLTWAGIRWAFTSGYASNWHPLTWLSHMLDVQLFGLDPGAAHGVNVFLHICSTLLLFLFLYQATAFLPRARLRAGVKPTMPAGGGTRPGYKAAPLWMSAMVAALFAVHPAHVESVAWIAERKDVLSGCCWMLALVGYVYFVRRPSAARCGLVLAPFALGLLAKPMLVTFPLVLLVLDYWPLNRRGPGHLPLTGTARDGDGSSRPPQQPPGTEWTGPERLWLVLEKTPLFIMAAASAWITYIAQQGGGSVAASGALPLSARLGNAVVAYVRYIFMLIWPVDLAVFYPHPGPLLPAWHVAGASVILAGLSLAMWQGRRRFPYLLAGWGWYAIMLLPVIGIVQVGAQALADRYTYLPYIGLFIPAVWGAHELARRLRLPRLLLPAAAMTVILLQATVAARQTRYWQNSTLLFTHALEVTTGNHLAHKNLGVALANEGRPGAAAMEYREAIRLKPDDPDLYFNLGLALIKLHDPDGAVAAFEQADRLRPGHLATCYNLGDLLGRKGRYAEAATRLETVLKLQPDHLGAMANLGIIRALTGQPAAAAALFRQAIRLDPANPDHYLNLGNALAVLGEDGEAIGCYRQALQRNPDHAGAHAALGVLLEKQTATAQRSKE